MSLKTLFTCTALGAGLLLAAQDYLESFKAIAARGAAESKEKYWQGKHFGDTPFKPEDKIFKGRSSHDSAMMYWNFMDAKLNGNQESLQRALTHYRFITGQFWDEKKQLFRSDYDFLMNTSIALTLCFSLRDAGDVIPADVKEDIRLRLRGIAAYLPTYTTALTNNADLRANNQDSFASLALALISEELKDDKIRKDALVKYRQVLDKTQQSFWIEGGVDVGYQSVGEPAFAAAADILWDDLSFEEKKKVADLGLNNVIGNGYGLENARSTSWIRSGGARAFSAGLLGRVPNSKIAADAEILVNNTAKKGFSSRWWLHDPASISFFTGFYKQRDKIAEIPKNGDLFGCASLACQMMERDEQLGWYTGMEKGYMTGDLGTTAMFGDYSRFSSGQYEKKFGVKTPPVTQSGGNLRYLGLNNQLYVCPDATLGMPRLNSVDLTRAPQTMHRAMYPGAGGSVYVLRQIMPGLNATPSQEVTQSFVMAGDVLLAFFSAPDFSGLRYDLAVVNYYKLQEENGRFNFWQNSMTDKKSRHLCLIPFGITLEEDKAKYQPYFKNELALEQKKIKLPQLRRVRCVFDSEKHNAVLLLSPEGRARDGKIEENNDLVTVSFTSAKRKYLVILPNNTGDTIELDGVRIDSPRPGFPQIAVFSEKGEIIAFTGNAKAMAARGKELFRAEERAFVSGLLRKDGWLLDINGSAEILLGQTGQSWVDGRTLPLPATLANDRVLIQP